ncbi:hypothetical protein [Pseudoalteromonas sp. Of7M-16]|uniref:hypothetical protein n=1 Tax=Pseudoalteromonas sp. Of7M-16 TaxID=2917756 RepID=UPI001EF619EF|nr:hypothetical protein [Pseudoalteromonas sp. Of7M-16]MCG7550908.1 hypothetical protein [Pseudoalteromonas sp. Of7M-16]
MQRNWHKGEEFYLSAFAGRKTAKEIGKTLNRTEKSVHRKAQEMKVSFHKALDEAVIKLAIEFRQVGFYRRLITVETGLSSRQQLYYEKKFLNG